jgi:hypothetical protein
VKTPPWEGNPQERINMQDTDLAWLAGIWDGEGSILLYSRPVNDNRIQITPSVTMTNTDVAIVNKARKIIEEMGCSFSWREYKPKGKDSYKTCFKISSAHAGNIKIFLEHILPFLVGEKKAYGETLLAFVSRRFEKAKNQLGGLKHLPYDSEDYEFIRSSTTTRETSKDEDIV